MKQHFILSLPIILCFVMYGCKQDIHTGVAKLETEKLKDGITKVVGSTIDGKKQGLWVTYDDSGRVTSCRTYVNDSLLGEEINYWENGRISSRRYLKGEEIQGEWIQYYDFDKNKVAQKGSYKDGNKVGVWEYYLEDGRLNKKIEYTQKGERVIVDNHLIPEIPQKK